MVHREILTKQETSENAAMVIHTTIINYYWFSDHVVGDEEVENEKWTNILFELYTMEMMAVTQYHHTAHGVFS